MTCSHTRIDDRASVGPSAEGIMDPTEETDGSYAGTLRCSKTTSMTETAPSDIDCREGDSSGVLLSNQCSDMYVDDGVYSGRCC